MGARQEYEAMQRWATLERVRSVGESEGAAEPSRQCITVTNRSHRHGQKATKITRHPVHQIRHPVHHFICFSSGSTYRNADGEGSLYCPSKSKTAVTVVPDSQAERGGGAYLPQ